MLLQERERERERDWGLNYEGRRCGCDNVIGDSAGGGERVKEQWCERL